MKAWVDALLRRTLPWWSRGSVLGDLEEEFRRRSAADGPRSAERWYAREALSICVRYSTERWRTPPDWPRPSHARAAHVMTDLAHAARGLRRSPGFALVAAFTLAVGIAANVSVYALIDAVLFRPLSRVEPERLVRLATTSRKAAAATRFGFSYPDYRDIQSQSRTLTDVTVTNLTPLVLRVSETSAEILGEVVSGSYFPVLHVNAVRGRTLSAADDSAGAPPGVVISQRLHERHFAGANPVGQTMFLNNRAFTIVGVIGREFGGTFVGAPIDVWLCAEAADGLFAKTWRTDRRSTGFNLLARLAPGVSRARAQAELDIVASGIAEREPAARQDLQLRIADGSLVRGGQRQSAAMFAVVLAVLVGLVLLIVGANVANLLLARGMSLRRQMAIRLALGATRWRLMWLVMAESLILSVIGGAGALWMSAGVMRVLSTFAPLPTLTVDLGLRLDTHTVVAAGVLALLTGVLLGAMPALHASAPDVQAVLREDSRTTTAGRSVSRLRAVLVVGQIAVSVLLLSSAGLFIRSLANARHLDLGFRPEHGLAIDLDTNAKNLTPAQRLRLFDELAERLHARADVTSVAFSNRAPVDASTPSVDVIVGGAAADHPPQATMYLASPEYFDAVSMPLIQGRAFDRADNMAAAKVAIVNRTMAERFWPGDRAIGQTFRTVAHGPAIQIVGIARDSMYTGLGEAVAPHVYLPYAQGDTVSGTLIVSVAGDPRPLLAPIQRELDHLSTPLEGFFARTLTDHLKLYRLPGELAAAMSAVLSGVALLIAAVGLYGLIAYMVGQRTNEIAIRIALGAAPHRIRSMVLGSGIRLLIPGIAIGLLGAAGVGALASSLLYKVGPADPLSMAAAAAVIAAVVLTASYLPARQAMRVDPAGVLR
jgi:predicted permease